MHTGFEKLRVRLISSIVLPVAKVRFEILSEIREVEAFAVGKSIRDVASLKLKGLAYVRLRSGRIRLAELHWYEAHGIGKKDIKRKRYLD